MKFEKQKVYSFFKDNILGAALTDMQLRISKYNIIISIFTVWSIFIVNMYGLLLYRTKKVLELSALFKEFWMSLGTNQTK